MEAVEGGAGQVVLQFVHGNFGLAHPVAGGVFVFMKFFVEHVLVGDRNRHLGFHLEILVLHVEDDLFDEFFRILRAVHQVVDVCAN